MYRLSICVAVFPKLFVLEDKTNRFDCGISSFLFGKISITVVRYSVDNSFMAVPLFSCLAVRLRLTISQIRNAEILCPNSGSLKVFLIFSFCQKLSRVLQKIVYTVRCCILYKIITKFGTFLIKSQISIVIW